LKKENDEKEQKIAFWENLMTKMLLLYLNLFLANKWKSMHIYMEL